MRLRCCCDLLCCCIGCCALSTEGTVITGSYFSPYVTTVGLYNELNQLLAGGKLAQPLPTSRTTDTSILVNIDRQ